ncbi:hypothetical protein PQR64_31820 [Paraburkholderia phytofirmans]|uniref:hypothetical protein n=1 Tax=Paraburkholderia phytofirmans TaxID=261302 RepID=UPI0038B926A4
MAASDDSIREELTGAMLSERSLLRFTSRYEQSLNYSQHQTPMRWPKRSGAASKARDQLSAQISPIARKLSTDRALPQAALRAPAAAVIFAREVLHLLTNAGALAMRMGASYERIARAQDVDARPVQVSSQHQGTDA